MLTISLARLTREYLRKDPGLSEILSRDRELQYHDGTFVICNLTDDEKLALEQESLLSRLKQRVRDVTRSLYGTEAHTLTLVKQSGARFSFALPKKSVNPMVLLNTANDRPDISKRLMELLQLPQATGITCVATNKIIAVSARLAHLCQFQHELEMWGCNSGDGWYPQELEKLNRHLDQIGYGRSLGTETEAYEYPAIALVDVLDGMKRGLPKPDAIAEARRINIAATFSRDIFSQKPVRVVTMHGLQFA